MRLSQILILFLALSWLNPSVASLGLQPYMDLEDLRAGHALIPGQRFEYISYLPDEGTKRRVALRYSDNSSRPLFYPGDRGQIRDSVSGRVYPTSARHKSLLGLYPRSPVRSTQGYPERTIGHFADQCSATMVGPRHALTAAHCVWDHHNQKFFSFLDFSPGKSRANEPFGTYRPKKILMPVDYKLRRDTESDFALLVFDEELGREIGWVGFGVASNSHLRVQIIGYPTDKAFATPWRATCPANLGRNTLSHQCDTTIGMSGSPLFQESSEFSSGNPMIIGIHTHGGIDFNGGKNINEQVFSILSYWIDENSIYTQKYILDESSLPLPSRSFTLEVKNPCVQSIRVVAKKNSDFVEWRTINPGETMIYTSIEDSSSFKLYGETLGHMSYRVRLSDEIDCALKFSPSGRVLCMSQIDFEQMNPIFQNTYRTYLSCKRSPREFVDDILMDI